MIADRSAAESVMPAAVVLSTACSTVRALGITMTAGDLANTQARTSA